MKQPTEEQAKMPEEEKSSHEFELVGKKAGAKNELLLRIAHLLRHIWENGKEHYVSIVRISTSVEEDVKRPAPKYPVQFESDLMSYLELWTEDVWTGVLRDLTQLEVLFP